MKYLYYRYRTRPDLFSSSALFQDVNNDGFKDVILGESPESSSTAGAAYVVFGSETFSAIELDVSALDGTNGFKIEGTDNGDYAGTAVAGVGVSIILHILFLKGCGRSRWVAVPSTT